MKRVIDANLRFSIQQLWGWEAWTRRVFVSTQSVKCAASPDSFNETVARQGHTIVVAAQAKTCP